MPLVSDRCICLRKHEYSETSQILTLFSRDHGIIRLIAKGAHRRTKAGASKFDGGIDLLDTGQAVFTHDPSRELSVLTEWKLIDGRLDLRQTLRGLYLALYAAELISLLIEEHDPHPDLFDRTDHALSDLATPRVEESFLALQLELLREAGYLPELSACVSCGRPLADQPAFFSPSRGSVVCKNCQPAFPDKIPADFRLLRLAAGLIRLPQRLPRLTRHQTDPLNRLFATHIQHTLGHRLRLLRYILPPRSSNPIPPLPAQAGR